MSILVEPNINVEDNVQGRHKNKKIHCKKNRSAVTSFHFFIQIKLQNLCWGCMFKSSKCRLSKSSKFKVRIKRGKAKFLPISPKHWTIGCWKHLLLWLVPAPFVHSSHGLGLLLLHHTRIQRDTYKVKNKK